MKKDVDYEKMKTPDLKKEIDYRDIKCKNTREEMIKYLILHDQEKYIYDNDDDSFMGITSKYLPVHSDFIKPAVISFLCNNCRC